MTVVYSKRAPLNYLVDKCDCVWLVWMPKQHLDSVTKRQCLYMSGKSVYTVNGFMYSCLYILKEHPPKNKKFSHNLLALMPNVYDSLQCGTEIFRKIIRICESI